MPYLFDTPDDRRAMLEAIGVESIGQLFDEIPAPARLDRPLDLPDAAGEMELTRQMAELAGKNAGADRNVCFLGGGSYDHFIPAVVDAIASRGEFLTSYTPYQAEVSQGTLQAMFEYQTLICQLTGMDVSNASLYDGGSAVAEAALLCASATRRSGRVVVSRAVHPEYRQVLETYLANLETELVTVPADRGATSVARVEEALDEGTACVIVGHPNFFGTLEDVPGIADAAHKAGALLVQVFDPISLGLFKPPAALGANVAVAEGQSLGSPMAFGGPYLGIMACRDSFVRRLPGRIVGQTVDRRDRRCWTLTLQTREQHIRREKATSNICTNQGLLALRAAVYLATMGPEGMRDAARLCLEKAHYAAGLLAESDRFEPAFAGSFFKEFVVRDKRGRVEELLAEAREHGIFAGVPLGRWHDALDDCFLVAVTERRTKAEIDAWAAVLTG